MNTAERYNAVLNFEKPDRLPILEWADWWNKSLERWYSEGLPQGLDRYELCEYFGLDILWQLQVRPDIYSIPPAAYHGAGRIKDEADYEKIRKQLYPKDLSTLIDMKNLEYWSERRSRGECAVWLWISGMFWFPRTMFGIEAHLYSFYDYPELYHKMNCDIVEYNIRVVELVSKHIDIDFVCLAEDMSYNNGSMISRELFYEFMAPYYRELKSFLNTKEIKMFVDSDGNIHENAIWFEDCGVSGILPLERKAGCDMAKLRKDHPKMNFLGGYDKLIMADGEDALRREFERLMPVAQTGGYLISCDHQTPPGVSLENYKLYLKLFKEYAKTI